MSDVTAPDGDSDYKELGIEGGQQPLLRRKGFGPSGLRKSLCEHHMLSFLGQAHVAYIPAGEVIGLSKIPRIVEMVARRLQGQERMTQEIAQFLRETPKPQGVAVVCEGLHMCAAMRGVKKANARMVTSSMVGDFKSSQATRNEFFAHLERGDA